MKRGQLLALQGTLAARRPRAIALTTRRTFSSEPPRTSWTRPGLPPAPPVADSWRAWKRLGAACAGLSAAALLAQYGSDEARTKRADSADAADAASAAAPSASPSAFDDPRLAVVLAQRARAAVELRAYLGEAQAEVNALQQAKGWDAAAKAKKRAEVQKKAERIMYGVQKARARDEYVARYGCAAWTDEATEAVLQHSLSGASSSLIEVGAGHGQWAKELRRRGATVLAFDNGAAIPTFGAASADFGSRVLHGGPEKIAGHPGKTLLLVFPPPESSMAAECVRHYAASDPDFLLYVGEGRGGATADAAFFDELDARYTVEKTVELKPFGAEFDAGCEKLWVLRKKNH